MGEDGREIRICPKCNQSFWARPALSRVDNETLICPDCGIREALESISVNKREDQDHVLALIHAQEERRQKGL